MTNPIPSLTSEVTSETGHSLAETSSEKYDAILEGAIERYDDLPINDTAVRELTKLAGRVGVDLNTDALRSGTLLDGAILFAELVEKLDRRQHPEAPAA
jgi:hypothetical protein